MQVSNREIFQRWQACYVNTMQEDETHPNLGWVYFTNIVLFLYCSKLEYILQKLPYNCFLRTDCRDWCQLERKYTHYANICTIRTIDLIQTENSEVYKKRKEKITTINKRESHMPYQVILQYLGCHAFSWKQLRVLCTF